MAEFRLLSRELPDIMQMADRTRGEGVLHVSDVIHDLCVRLGHYPARGADDTMPVNRMRLGNAWEWAVASCLRHEHPDRYVDLGELCQDGMYLTPDLYDTWTPAVEEVKATWMSERHGDDPEGVKFWRYWRQVQAYCWAIGCQVGRLRVAFVNGAGGFKSRDSGARVWEARWTRQELAENWELLRRHGETMRQAQQGQVRSQQGGTDG